MSCLHAKRTKPSLFRVRAEGSQEIIGEAMIEVCLQCCHTTGNVKNGSLFNPKGPFPFVAPTGHDIEEHARKALLG